MGPKERDVSSSPNKTSEVKQHPIRKRNAALPSENNLRGKPEKKSGGEERDRGKERVMELRPFYERLLSALACRFSALVV